MADVLEYQDQEARLRAAVEAYARHFARNFTPDDRERFVAGFVQHAIAKMTALDGTAREHRALVRDLTGKLAP